MIKKDEQLKKAKENQEIEMIRDLVMKNRSYRRFYEELAIEFKTLRQLVDLARLSPFINLESFI